MQHYSCPFSLFRIFWSYSACMTFASCCYLSFVYPDLHHSWLFWGEERKGALGQTVKNGFLCLSQFARRTVGSPVQTRGSVATASAWVAAPNRTTTWPAPLASITTTRVGVSRTVPPGLTSLTAGAASLWTCALKSTCPVRFTLSATMESACRNVRLASHVTRLISKYSFFILGKTMKHWILSGFYLSTVMFWIWISKSQKLTAVIGRAAGLGFVSEIDFNSKVLAYTKELCT